MKLFKTHQQLLDLEKKYEELLTAQVEKVEPGYVSVIKLAGFPSSQVMRDIEKVVGEQYPKGEAGVVLTNGKIVKTIVRRDKNES